MRTQIWAQVLAVTHIFPATALEKSECLFLKMTFPHQLETVDQGIFLPLGIMLYAKSDKLRAIRDKDHLLHVYFYIALL